MQGWPDCVWRVSSLSTVDGEWNWVDRVWYFFVRNKSQVPTENWSPYIINDIPCIFFSKYTVFPRLHLDWEDGGDLVSTIRLCHTLRWNEPFFCDFEPLEAGDRRSSQIIAGVFSIRNIQGRILTHISHERALKSYHHAENRLRIG